MHQNLSPCLGHSFAPEVPQTCILLFLACLPAAMLAPQYCLLGIWLETHPSHHQGKFFLTGKS